VLLLADLLRRFPDLPAAAYTIDTHGEPQLAVSIHSSVRTAFEAWREALGLPTGEVWLAGAGWVMASGRVSDVLVRLSGYGSPDEIAAMVELSDAVSLLGALPMPTGAAAEDPHDSPLHHSYALGRDLPEVTS
jgi:hypothetical protein